MKKKRKLAPRPSRQTVLGILTEDARLAQLAGVALQLADWHSMSDDERAAWLTARGILAQAASKAVARSARHAPEAVTANDEAIRAELEASASRILGEDEAG